MSQISFQTKLCSLINQFSKEKDSNTPDFVLAKYVLTCLRAFNEATIERDRWYGVLLCPGRSRITTTITECPECQQNKESGMNFCAFCGRQLWDREG